MNKEMNMLIATRTLLIVAVMHLTPVALSAEDSVKVTADTYVRAETDYQFKTYVDKVGCFSKFFHNRKPYDVDNQTTVRANRDTLYSFGVFDLTSPVTITLPDPKGRYQCLMPISQDHSITFYYGPKEVTLTKEMIGTRYVFVAIRTFMDPSDEADVKVAHQLQDVVVVKQDEREHLKFRIGTRKGLRPCEQPSTCSPPPFLTHHPSLVKKMS